MIIVYKCIKQTSLQFRAGYAFCQNPPKYSKKVRDWVCAYIADLDVDIGHDQFVTSALKRNHNISNIPDLSDGTYMDMNIHHEDILNAETMTRAIERESVERRHHTYIAKLLLFYTPERVWDEWMERLLMKTDDDALSFADTRRPSQRGKAPPPGTPFHHPHSEQRRPARAHAGGPVLGTHARIDRTRDTRVAEPWQPAPEDGRPGEGQRLTPGAPHKGGKHPPRGRPSATPTASNTGPRGLTLWGRCGDPTPAPTAPRTRGTRNPGCPLQRTGGQGPPPPQPQAKEGGTGTGPPPPKHARRSTGPGQDTRRGTDQVERPYQRPVPGPREMRAPHHPAGGGADPARARAHTHEKNTRGLPEGQPDRARGTHRPHGMAYQRARVRDTRRGRPATRSAEHAGREGGNRRDTTPGTGPNPPRTGRERRAHTDGTLHPPRQ